MLDRRFWSKVEVTGFCWFWTAMINKGRGGGYGKFWTGGRMQSAHRVAYEDLVGPIEEGQQLDHLCRTRSCVNPDHLQQVSNLENALRSPITAAGKLFCVRGHWLADSAHYKNGRYCRECRTTDERRAYIRMYMRKERALERRIIAERLGKPFKVEEALGLQRCAKVIQPQKRSGKPAELPRRCANMTNDPSGACYLHGGIRRQPTKPRS